jgi:hypothetical protein
MPSTYNQELPGKYLNLLEEYSNVKSSGNSTLDDKDYIFSTKIWEFQNYFPQFNITEVLK